MKKRMMAWLLAGMMAASALTGCGGKTEQEPAPAAPDAAASEETGDGEEADSSTAAAGYKEEIHIGYKIEPATLDTMMVGDAPARVISYGSIYEALVTMDADFKVREELCESYEVSADAKEYTWKLRQGVKFHNGEEMKADDVVNGSHGTFGGIRHGSRGGKPHCPGFRSCPPFS